MAVVGEKPMAIDKGVRLLLRAGWSVAIESGVSEGDSMAPGRAIGFAGQRGGAHLASLRGAPAERNPPTGQNHGSVKNQGGVQRTSWNRG